MNTDTTTSRPLRADAERNRRRILAAAREVFARRGLDAGLDEIAKHAGVGTGTVYRRFPDKKALVEALFTERLADLTATAHRAAGHPDPWAGLVELLESAVAMQIEDRGLKDLLFAYGDKGAFREQLAVLQEVLREVCARAVAAGDLRPDVDLTDLATVQLMTTQVAAFAEPESPGLWRRYLGLMLDGLCTRRESPTPLPHPPLDTLTFERLCHPPR
ncbi:TetR/AcrR family transcriptional regulator [Pseudonocardia ailaonensis]|uniref:TetR/AcrR family transcriptional regulator n=1 Tax=Pseudonocardia ailaonensis TaxID=367279 RepID=A0ABN2N376_9PSEU